jgi:hypothetical protein
MSTNVEAQEQPVQANAHQAAIARCKAVNAAQQQLLAVLHVLADNSLSFGSSDEFLDHEVPLLPVDQVIVADILSSSLVLKCFRDYSMREVAVFPATRSQNMATGIIGTLYGYDRAVYDDSMTRYAAYRARNAAITPQLQSFERKMSNRATRTMNKWTAHTVCRQGGRMLPSFLAKLAAYQATVSSNRHIRMPLSTTAFRRPIESSSSTMLSRIQRILSFKKISTAGLAISRKLTACSRISFAALHTSTAPKLYSSL